MCDRLYPVRSGIPEFIRGGPWRCDSPILQGVEKIDRLVGICETRLWYLLVMTVYGGWAVLRLVP